MKRLSLISMTLCLTSQLSFGQTNEDLGSWIMYFGSNKISPKLSIHTEIQYRSYSVLERVEQMMWRTGLNYHISTKAMATGGIAYIPSWGNGDPFTEASSEETRIWQQFILKNNVGRFGFEHRYRIEQRLINTVDGMKGRFRYRLMVTAPFNKEKMEPGAIFAGFYDEVFVDASSVEMDRNRIYLALGYQPNATMNFQAGFLIQTYWDKSTLIRVRYDQPRLQLAWIWNPKLYKDGE